MRNWFKDQDTRRWTWSVYVKRLSGSSSLVGIVDNGDCVDDATFLIRGDESAGSPSAFSGARTSDSPGGVTTSDQVKWSTDKLVLSYSICR